MFSRNAQPCSSTSALPDDTLRRDIEDLYAENLISAQRTAKLLRKAFEANVNVPKQIRKSKGKNQARAQARHSLKRTKWPDLYEFECRVRNRKTELEERTTLCMLLPNEVLAVLWERGLPEVLLSTTNLDSAGKAHLEHMKEQLHVEEIMGFGIHGDGIPCNYDRTESVVMISINLPGLSGKNGRARIPLIALPDWSVSEHTFDDVMEVIAWSLRHLLLSERPCCRHDGTAFGQSDARRAKPAYKAALPIRACLVQVRGDWDWMGKCFHFPFHGVKEGCCWLCACKRSEVRSPLYN
jgi:hypothetical protein